MDSEIREGREDTLDPCWRELVVQHGAAPKSRDCRANSSVRKAGSCDGQRQASHAPGVPNLMETSQTHPFFNGV